MGKGGKKDPKNDLATPAVVSAVLNAEWLLKGESFEDLLIETTRLQDAIKGADLAGLKDLDKNSTDDEDARGAEGGGEPDARGGPGRAGNTLLRLRRQRHGERPGQGDGRRFRQGEEPGGGHGESRRHRPGPFRRLESRTAAGADSEAAEDPNQAYLRMLQGGGRAAPSEEDESLGEARG